MNRLNYEIVALSDIGERPENQDYVEYTESRDEKLMVLCDGMGGFEGGSLASQAAAAECIRLFEQRKGEPIREFFEYSMDCMDYKVSGLRGVGGKGLQAGTTVVAALINEDSLSWLSVGDSRMYIIRNGKINQMTRDHTVELKAKYDYSKGLITIDEYDDMMRDKSVLCSYIGLKGIDIYDINAEPLRLRSGDVIILATDGLYKSLDNEGIRKIVIKNNDAAGIAKGLLDMAACIAKGCNQDNTSVIVCKVH